MTTRTALVFLMLGVAAPTLAQQSAPLPDLEITARVTARELHFEQAPAAHVEFPGHPARETAWTTDRQNLPPEVAPGVTYRDIGITLEITSVFSDIDRIVAEALGEAPITPETKTNEKTPE